MKLTDAVKIWDEIPSDFDTGEPLYFKDFIAAIDIVVGVENDIPAIGGCYDEEILSTTEEILTAVPLR
jgi:hypothetical protein